MTIDELNDCVRRLTRNQRWWTGLNHDGSYKLYVQEQSVVITFTTFSKFNAWFK